MKDLKFTDSEFEALDNSLSQKKAYVLNDVKDKVVKVAFDVVRFDGDDLSHLWQIKKTDDGTEVIVAMYDDTSVKTASASEWEAVSDARGNISVFYKGDAIHRFAASQFGFDSSDVKTVCKTLTASLHEDRNFVSALVKEIPTTSREMVLRKYPELKDNS